MNLNIYRVALVNKAKEEQTLSLFNGENDLLEICNKYYYSLRKDRIKYFDARGGERTFSISSKIDFLRIDRTLITSFDSAYTGEEVCIRNAKTNNLNYRVNKDELQSRTLFSLFYIPKNSKYGYVVFESKANHGVKIAFERGFQSFLKVSGYEDYRLIMTPTLNYNYLSNFIIKGKLKKIRLIENVIKKDVQLTLWDNVSSNGKDIREFGLLGNSDHAICKDELYKLFFSKLNKNEKIQFRDNYIVDEISFEMNYKGASKVFYIKERNSMRPLIDVSKDLVYVEGEPTYDSMVKASINLISEILGNNLLDLSIAA
ncbi:hypothetical protein DZC78_11965 [Olleya aquimaris]|nr:hypothetical protein DZC78_11965 [Olleya aquimaris]